MCPVLDVSCNQYFFLDILSFRLRVGEGGMAGVERGVRTARLCRCGETLLGIYPISQEELGRGLGGQVGKDGDSSEDIEVR